MYSTETELALQVAGHGDIHGAHSTLRQDWYAGQQNERISIELLALDHYALTQNFGTIRLWKLDVEGSELEALKGAASLLGSKSIQALYIEINDPAKTEIPEYLHQFGYIPMRIDKRGNAGKLNGRISQAHDYLFLPVFD